MFDVLVYVYENYWQGTACPESDILERKLSAAGFESHEIRNALDWLDGLNLATHESLWHLPADAATSNLFSAGSPQHLRIYSAAEQHQLQASCLGFLSFLENAGALTPQMREIVLDRAMAVADAPVSMDEFKTIILMVYWSLGHEPDALILDELCSSDDSRTVH